MDERKGKEMFVTGVFEGIRSGVCECVYREKVRDTLIHPYDRARIVEH
jgi:hypothetical protein